MALSCQDCVGQAEGQLHQGIPESRPLENTMGHLTRYCSEDIKTMATDSPLPKPRRMSRILAVECEGARNYPRKCLSARLSSCWQRASSRDVGMPSLNAETRPRIFLSARVCHRQDIRAGLAPLDPSSLGPLLPATCFCSLPRCIGDSRPGPQLKQRP